MTDLVGAYQRREVHEAEKILANNHATIMDDNFIRTYIQDVLRSLRTQYLIDLVQSYQRVELSFLASHLNISVPDVEELIMILILDGRIAGKIDQVQQQLHLSHTRNSLVDRRYTALHRWSEQVSNVGKLIQDKHSTSSHGSTSGLSRLPLGMSSMAM